MYLHNIAQGLPTLVIQVVLFLMGVEVGIELGCKWRSDRIWDKVSPEKVSVSLDTVSFSWGTVFSRTLWADRSNHGGAGLPSLSRRILNFCLWRFWAILIEMRYSLISLLSTSCHTAASFILSSSPVTALLIFPRISLLLLFSCTRAALTRARPPVLCASAQRSLSFWFWSFPGWAFLTIRLFGTSLYHRHLFKNNILHSEFAVFIWMFFTAAKDFTFSLLFQNSPVRWSLDDIFVSNWLRRSDKLNRVWNRCFTLLARTGLVTVNKT